MNKTFLNTVNDFHILFRISQPTPSEPFVTDAPTNKLRLELITEEFSELREAITSNQPVEVLDALCDLQYVLSGGILALGFMGVFNRRFNSYTGRSVEEVYQHIASRLVIRVTPNYVSKFGEAIVMLESALSETSSPEVLTALVSMQIELSVMVLELGFAPRFIAAFEEVHRSNMSKLWGDYERILAVDESLDLTFEKVAEDKYIAKRPDGKAIKSPSYSVANLKQFIKS